MSESDSGFGERVRGGRGQKGNFEGIFYNSENVNI